MEGTHGYAVKAIAESTIPYRPKFAQLTGKVTAAILLQQIVFYWQMNQRPFYKFRAPCEHDMYRDGDSWIECLGFSVTEFDTALKTIGTKITTGMNPQEVLEGTDLTSIVIYWTDSNRVTWYDLNLPLFIELTDPLYDGANSGNLNYQNQESSITRKIRKPEIHSSYIPENTHIVPPPTVPEQPPINVSRLLRGTLTKGEEEETPSQLASYIGQQFNSVVPSGQRNDLARGYTEQLPGGKKRKHPSPDELWLTHPQFPEFVEKQITWVKGKASGSNRAQRAKAVNLICRYKGNEHAWLEWVAKQPQVPRYTLIEDEPIDEEPAVGGGIDMQALKREYIEEQRKKGVVVNL